jgi:deoxyribonuclease V
MIAAVDVAYDELAVGARAAAVVFGDWTDSDAVAEYSAAVTKVEPYTPGAFYQRELPCLLAVLREVREPLTVILVDGYVDLGTRPGLGRHLWNALQQQCAVVGIAKSRFRGASAVEVHRGASRQPLYVTAAGMDVAMAADALRRMHGKFRIPTLLRRADSLAENMHG